MGTIYVNPGGTIKHKAFNSAIGATGGSITVPTGKRWDILQLTADLTTSATVGNRVMQCRIVSYDGDVTWVGAASGNVAASQVGGYDVAFGGSLATPSTTVRRNMANTANTNVQVRETSGARALKEGGFIVIDDSANIDNADALLMELLVVEYDV